MRFAALALVLLVAAVAAQDPTPRGDAVDATFVDRRWQRRSLAEFGAGRVTVVFFATVDCPLVQRYLPRIGRMARDYEARGVAFVVANVGADDPFVDAVGQVVEAAPAAEFARDFELSLAKALGVDRTATAVVLDAERRVVYRGRVDDQHGYAGARPSPLRDDLRLALDDVLAGRPVAVSTTEVSGCRITAPRASARGVAPTWVADVAPIVERHCVACHRPDGEAPFPLLTARDVERRAQMVAEVVAEGRMPPWYGSSAHGSFVNRRGLTSAERDTVVAWAEAGAPRGQDGDPTPLAAPASTGAWRIGEPDLVLSMKAPVRLPADGVVPYQYVVLPFRFEHDTWVEAIEIKPDNGRVLHHCNLARVAPGERFSQDNFVTGYVPGGDPMVLDPGTAVRIPAGSALALQAHYVTTGRPEQDRLRVGLRFPRVVVDKELKVTIVGNTRFEVPPGARAHPVRARRQLPVDAIGIGLFVHMHLRGRDMLVEAEHADGVREPLLLVPNYNFDWQQSYRWAAGARRFAAGTKVHALAHFDNSAWNPFNPDPTQTVGFGLETTDEMMYAFLFWVAEHEVLGLKIDPANGLVVGGG